MRNTMTTKPWDFGIQKELHLVDEKLHEMVKSREKVLTDASLHVIDAGGKRIRPTVTILAYRALGGSDVPKIVDIAAGFELIHSATLIHDDVVDQAPLRRGRPSANAQWGDDASVLVGDHLYSKSFAMLVRDNDRAVMETLARSTVSMTEAEVFQLERKLNVATRRQPGEQVVRLEDVSHALPPKTIISVPVQTIAG